ncbi:MAG: hypothetical protein QMD43_03025 [Thermodesulfovibrio sp.]|uniref:type IV pilus modification PilV family protein n=1 Tax=Thermodesulfovibrio sp. N1 TaxID=1871110 RepID=UPI00083AA006|nr:hypothetical protein [Thermodesulfovibrio sp. N1]MDI6713986.1 hypothetical protein [Thermodesulfovibrio sp.]ODA44996.1 hypothetical protein THER_0223 [Thermodesulfovibrio sp. N1]
MNNRGFSLVTVLILSLIIFVIGGTGAYIATTNLKTTQADTRYNIAEKASNVGLLRAFDEINQTGTGGNDRTITGTVGNATYNTRIMFGGKNIWFVSSEGFIGNSRVIKTAIFQGYYGVGLYTVRGNVNATLGSGVRLTGCDRAPEPDCLVPSFIASGTISTPGITPRTCPADAGGAGVYGQPPILNLNQGDLSRIFFKVKCFNKYGDSSCNLSLLDYLEYDYGRDTDFNPPHQYINFQQNVNRLGIPIVTLHPFVTTPPTVDPDCTFRRDIQNIDLGSSPYINCTRQIYLEPQDNNITITITGDGNRGGQRVAIFANSARINSITFNNARNFRLFTNRTTTIDNSQDFKLYTSGTTTLQGTIRNFRLISTNTVTAAANAIITTSEDNIFNTIVIGPTTATALNTNTSPQNFVSSGGITINNSNIFARSLRFANGSAVRILNSLVYVYAYACPNCPRNTSTSSLDACDSNNLWCGWFGDGISLNIGRDGAGNAQPVLFISNNTTVRTVNPSSTAFIWGVWYGEDVTYLRWVGTATQDLRGFLIRNFPENLTLTINIGSGFTLSFNKAIIDTITNRYRFFREVECVRDPLTPKAQMIQTRMVNY